MIAQLGRPDLSPYLTDEKTSPESSGAFLRVTQPEKDGAGHAVPRPELRTLGLCHLSEPESKSVALCLSAPLPLAPDIPRPWWAGARLSEQSPENPLEASSLPALPTSYLISSPGSAFPMPEPPSPAWNLLLPLPVHPKETGEGLLTSLPLATHLIPGLGW